MTEQERRLAFIQALRDCAEFFEQRPTLPIPAYNTLHIFAHERADLAAAARLASWEKVYADDWFFLRQTFCEDLKIDVASSRERVCRKVVTGERTIPAQPEQTVETFEWVCDEPSLLEAK